MDLAQLNQRIAVANAESQRINNERAINVGKKETLEKQLNDAITRYNSTYGTNIDISSLNAEIDRVSKEKEAEVTNIESMLSLIKEGKFDEAQSKTSGVATTDSTQSNITASPVVQPTQAIVQPNVEVPVAQPTAPALGDVPVSPQVATPAIGESVVSVPPVAPVIEEPVAPKAPVIEEPVVAPKAPVIEEPVAPPTAPPTPNLDTEVSSAPTLAPPVVGKPPVAPNLGDTVTPPPTSPVTSFNAILNGSQFKPQGN